MAKKKDYIETFQEEQRQQYTPWNYLAKGQPTPFDEAKGNPVPLAIAYLVISIGFLAVGIFLFSITDTVAVLAIMIVLCVFSSFVSIGYFRKAHNRNKRRKMRSAENRRKRSKYKAKKDG